MPHPECLTCRRRVGLIPCAVCFTTSPPHPGGEAFGQGQQSGQEQHMETSPLVPGDEVPVAVVIEGVVGADAPLAVGPPLT